MGEVYRAIDERLERPVALKRIRSDVPPTDRARRRFLREARAAAGLSHARIVRIYDLLTRSDDWIVMEWVDGSPMSRWLEGAPSLARRLRLAIDIVSALDAAHREGLIHRDLKASNVLVDLDGRAKLLDFGLVKRPDGHQEPSLTLEGQVVGTPHAMSPEQAMGRRLDFRTDLFSLGSLLYELTTGESPFRGPTALDSLHLVCAHAPPPLHQVVAVPERLSHLVERLLDKDPAQRPASAARALVELRRARDEVDDPSAPVALSPVTAVAAESTTITVGPMSSERRQMAVLVLRLARRGAAAGSLDLDRLRHLPHARIDAVVRETVERYGGHVEQLSESGAVACFGYPRIHEDDADRAVLTALALVDRLPGILPTELDLEARVAIGSGPVVILGEETGLLQLALGETLDAAQRTVRSMDAGEVWVGEATRRRLRRPFATERVLGNGRVEPGTQRVLGSRGSSSRWPMVPDNALLARDREIELLLDRAERSRTGRGQVVLIRGEAGIGKSTLVAELRRRLSLHDMAWWLLQGSDWAVHSPFQPLLEPLRRHLGLDRVEDPPLEILDAALRAGGFDPSTAVPLVGSLLGIPWERHYPPLAWTAKKTRQETFELLVDLVLEAAGSQALGLVVEDLHWIDSTTREWLDRLVDRLADRRLLLVTTTRPQVESPWVDVAGVTELGLERLPSRDVGALIDRVIGEIPLAEDVRQQITEKAGGVPLFVEELARSILESGQLEDRAGILTLRGDLDDLDLPATLESSIAARLDRLGPAKAVAQLASVIGREVPGALLEAVAELPAAELASWLDRLLDAGLVHRRGFGARQRYVFRHALVQDAAYDSLLAPHRRLLHGRIAACLERDFPRHVETQPELLAHHYTRAEVYDRAVELWQRAGQDMVRRSAIIEAVSHLESGVALVPSLPAGEARDRIELSLQSTLGSALATKEGFSATATIEAYQRAQSLGSRFEHSQERFWALQGLCRGRLASAQFRSNLPLCFELVEMANELADPDCVLAAHLFLAAQYFTTGWPQKSLATIDKGLAFDSTGRQPPLADQSSADPGVNMMSLRSRILWLLGRTDEALQQIEKASVHAARLGHPSTIAQVDHCRSMLHYDLRDPDGVIHYAGRVIEISKQQGSFWEHWTRPCLSWAEAMSSTDPSSQRLGDLRAALRRAVAHKAQIGFVYARPLYRCMLAQMWMLEQRPRKALDLLDEAYAIATETGEEVFLPEIDGLRGQAIVTWHDQGSSEASLATARACFERARDLADERQIVPFAAQATQGLARLA